MKWLNKVFGKEGIPASVAFDEIDTWQEQVSNSLFRGLSTNTSRLYKEISDTCDRLKQNSAELQDAEPKEDMPDTILKIGLLNRDKLVKNIDILTEKVVIPDRTDYKAVLAFYASTHSYIEAAFGKLSKTIYYVRSLFPDEVKEIESDIKRLKTALNLLITPIKGKEIKITNLERVPLITQDIKGLSSRIAKEKANVHNQEEASSAIESKIRIEEERLKMIEGGEDWAQLKELETDLSALKEELTAVESAIINLFSPINKELELLKKQDESGRYTLTPVERRAILTILSAPIQALGEEDITEYLRAIRNVIAGETSILKTRKREKTLRWIDHLLDTELSAIKGKRERVLLQIKQLKATLSDLTVLKEREVLEQSIVSANGQLAQLQEAITRSERHVVSLEEELTAKKQLLVEVLERIAGKEIEVEFGV